MKEKRRMFDFEHFTDFVLKMSVRVTFSSMVIYVLLCMVYLIITILF